MTPQNLTHKGWFGICPVYFGGLDTEGPIVVERHWSFLPLMMLSEWMYSLCFAAMEFIDPSFEPSWPLRITGEIRPQAQPAD